MRFKRRQIIILNGVQNYKPAQGAHISGARPACEINMGRMDSPYVTGGSSLILKESLIVLKTVRHPKYNRSNFVE
jgi:hypothetical protein